MEKGIFKTIKKLFGRSMNESTDNIVKTENLYLNNKTRN